MRTATAALLVVTLAVCVFICLLFRGASKSGREWKAQNLMLRQRWMQIVRPFAVDETATALFHGDRGLIDGIVTYENSEPTKGATVYAVPLGQPIIGPYPQGDTDQLGHFAIEISPAWFGRFAVIA